MGGEGEGKIGRWGLGWLTPFFFFWVCSAPVWDGVGGDMAFSFWVCGGSRGMGFEANDYVF